MTRPLTRDEETALRRDINEPYQLFEREIEALLATLDAERAKVARLREALHRISLSSQSSMSSKGECGRIAREVLAETGGES